MHVCFSGIDAEGIPFATQVFQTIFSFSGWSFSSCLYFSRELELSQKTITYKCTNGKKYLKQHFISGSFAKFSTQPGLFSTYNSDF